VIKKPKWIRLSYLLVAVCTLVFLLIFSFIDSAATSSGYCLSCHEMSATVGESWRTSAHFSNKLGVVAECSDCHVNPGMVGFFTTKLWPAIRDHYVHFAGGSDPATMNWEELRTHARDSIANGACKRCHESLTGASMSKAAKAAHSWAEENVSGEYRNCLACHAEPMHPIMSTGDRGPAEERMFSRIEVQSHDSDDDCYVVISEGVYDVTDFKKFHSGGSWCFDPGADNTLICSTCHKSEDALSPQHVDAYGEAISYELLPHELPLMRVGTVVDIKNENSPYYVERFEPFRIKPVVNKFGLIDDLGITKRFSVGRHGALRKGK